VNCELSYENMISPTLAFFKDGLLDNNITVITVTGINQIDTNKHVSNMTDTKNSTLSIVLEIVIR
jgi:hypothetical protein